MEWIYFGMGLIVFLLLAVIGWLKRICYVMIEVWRVMLSVDGAGGLSDTIDLFVSNRLGKMVNQTWAKRWYTLTRGEK